MIYSIVPCTRLYPDFSDRRDNNLVSVLLVPWQNHLFPILILFAVSPLCCLFNMSCTLCKYGVCCWYEKLHPWQTSILLINNSTTLAIGALGSIDRYTNVFTNKTLSWALKIVSFLSEDYTYQKHPCVVILFQF